MRKQLGYSADEVIRMLLRRADALAVPVMSATSLKTKVSRWENGHEAVSAQYQRLFRDIYGRTNEEVGFLPEQDDSDADELVARITVARRIDADMVERFRQQVENARHVDRRFGGVVLLDQLRSTIKQLEGLLTFSTAQGHREALAGILTEASALAGWEALDRAAFNQAWDHHERAKAAAHQAESPVLLAHATAQQAFILIDLGEIRGAVDLLESARSVAEHTAPSLLRAWLAAAHGEGLAAAGRRDDALRAFDTANALVPTDPVDPACRTCFSPKLT
ncbi:tetratricopeptide repeat protein [Kibdelosporangium philippinense]|uniref:tetratricopeptide repeat protein n=1 Tax=Kibdelosporangium philippinense TaxID=211113 RepID=UPI0027DEC676|nr:tetratricopeptide repeat protein [Kibdelosporangium philippinense]